MSIIKSFNIECNQCGNCSPTVQDFKICMDIIKHDDWKTKKIVDENGEVEYLHFCDWDCFNEWKTANE